jgi:type II secretory pathway component GspD/PulD (secretin)
MRASDGVALVRALLALVTMKKLVVLLVLAAAGLRAGAVPAAKAAEAAGDTCRKLPPGKRLVKLTLKPETDIGDLISWISSVTCAQFVVPGSIDVRSKKVTIIAPTPITAAEAYQLFLDALDSVDLTVVRTGRFLRVVETTKAKTQPIPFFVGDSRTPVE